VFSFSPPSTNIFFLRNLILAQCFFVALCFAIPLVLNIVWSAIGSMEVEVVIDDVHRQSQNSLQCSFDSTAKIITILILAQFFVLLIAVVVLVGNFSLSLFLFFLSFLSFLSIFLSLSFLSLLSSLSLSLSFSFFLSNLPPCQLLSNRLHWFDLATSKPTARQTALHLPATIF
jgi:hypothetical protein